MWAVKYIGVGASEFLGVQIILPKLGQKVVVQILPTVFWCDHRRTRRGVGGCGRPPGLKNFRANSVSRAHASSSKILNDKKYIFNTMKNSRATLFFSASASCSKILNVKSVFHTVKIFRATLFFRVSVRCSKILNDKKYFNTLKTSRATLFFRASASCSKILNNENYTVYSVLWIQGNLCFSGQSQVAQNSWM